MVSVKKFLCDGLFDVVRAHVHVAFLDHDSDDTAKIVQLISQKKSICRAAILWMKALIAVPEDLANNLDDLGALLSKHGQALSLGWSQTIEVLGHLCFLRLEMLFRTKRSAFSLRSRISDSIRATLIFLNKPS